MFKVKVKVHHARQNNFPSIYLINVSAIEESPNAFKLTGEFQFKQSSVCWRCNKIITSESALKIGLGPDCAINSGLDPKDYETSLPRFQFNDWIPKNMIDQIFDTSNDEYRHDFGAVKLNIVHDVVYDNKIRIGLRKSPNSTLFTLTTTPPRISNEFFNALREIDGHKWDRLHQLNTLACTGSVAKAIESLAENWKFILDFSCKEVEDKFNELLQLGSANKGTLEVTRHSSSRVEIATSPKFIGYAFVKKLKTITGFQWDGTVWSFPITTEILFELGAIAEEYGLLYTVSDDIQDTIDQMIKDRFSSIQQFSKFGISSLDDLKTVVLPDGDWFGLKPGITLRTYQRGAVAFACALLGIKVEGLENE